MPTIDDNQTDVDPSWLPVKSELHEWWQIFWLNKTQPFGDPSKKLMEVIETEITGRSGFLSAIDIASGNGRYAIPLAKLGCQVTALEWTEAGINEIRKRAAIERITVRCEQADFVRECNSDRQYEILVCSGLLEEIDPSHHIKVIRGFSRWTAKGGVSIIKYCHEIQGRGTLVPEDFVGPILEAEGMRIEFLHENRNLRRSNATGLFTRTGTVVARKLG